MHLLTLSSRVHDGESAIRFLQTHGIIHNQRFVVTVMKCISQRRRIDGDVVIFPKVSRATHHRFVRVEMITLAKLLTTRPILSNRDVGPTFKPLNLSSIGKKKMQNKRYIVVGACSEWVSSRPYFTGITSRLVPPQIQHRFLQVRKTNGIWQQQTLRNKQFNIHKKTGIKINEKQCASGLCRNTVMAS